MAPSPGLRSLGRPARSGGLALRWRRRPALPYLAISALFALGICASTLLQGTPGLFGAYPAVMVNFFLLSIGRALLMVDADHFKRVNDLHGHPVTVSMGVALREPGETGEAWLRRGDLALLTAKREGRDRVVLAPGLSGTPGTAGPSAGKRPPWQA